jgi:outer membrane protein
MLSLAIFFAMATPPEPLTLEGAMAYAREHAPAAGSADAQAIIARARVDVARATWWPTVAGSLATTAGAGNSHALFGNDPVCSDPTLGVCTNARTFGNLEGVAAVDARTTVFDFGRRSSLVSSAESAAEAAMLDARAARDQIAAAAAVAFLTAQANEELLTARRAIVERRASALSFAEERVRIGVAPPIEATRARLSLETAKLDVATAQAAVDDAQASLARALGLDPGRRVALSPAGPLAAVDDPAKAADLAEVNRPEIKAQRRRIAASDADFSGARAGLWPSLSTHAGATARANGYTTQPANGVESARLGLALTIPIFDPSLGASIRVAEAAASAQRSVEKERLLAVRADAAQAAIAVRAQKEALKGAEVLSGEAEANLAQAEGRYQAGAGSLLELVDAQTQQSAALLSLAQARFALAIAEARLLAAVGMLGGG